MFGLFAIHVSDAWSYCVVIHSCVVIPHCVGISSCVTALLQGAYSHTEKHMRGQRMRQELVNREGRAFSVFGTPPTGGRPMFLVNTHHHVILRLNGFRILSDHTNWRSSHHGHPDFVVNLSSRACGACHFALREHARELHKAISAQRDVSDSSAGVISDPHEDRGAGGASTSRAIPQDVLMCNSPRDADVSRVLSHVSNNALLVGLAVQNAALSRKLKLK